MGFQKSGENSSNVVKTKFTESLMDAAKRKSLLGFLEVNQIPYFKQSGGHASKYCPNCGESSEQSNKCNISHELWHCHACGKGGTIVDYAMYQWGTGVVDAAKKLVADDIQVTDMKPGELREQAIELDLTDFYATLKQKGATYNKEAWDYLQNERQIPEEIIKDAVNRGILRFLPGNYVENSKWLIDTFGGDELKRLGFWKKDRKTNDYTKFVGVSSRSIIFILPTLKSAEWRLCKAPTGNMKKSLRYGLDKSYWFWEGVNSKKVSVVEGPIDMLSMVAFGWDGDIKALPGTGVWQNEWMDGYEFAAFTLDNDAAGQLAMKSMSEAATEKGIRFKAKAPLAGDINEQWKQLKTKAA